MSIQAYVVSSTVNTVVNAYADLPTALTAIGVTVATLIIQDAQSVSTATVPSNVLLRFIDSGQITVSGTLTINGGIEAPPRQIFAGAGTITYGSNIGIIYPAWTGVTNYNLKVPTSAGTSGYVLSTDGSGTLSWVAQTAGGADTALSNLSAVAINTPLLPASDLTINAGSGTKRFLTTFTGGVSSTSVTSKNLAGTVAFSTAGTATVTFGTSEPDASYRIALSWDTNENIWWSAKGTSGFTVNSSNGSSIANVDWHLLR